MIHHNIMLANNSGHCRHLVLAPSNMLPVVLVIMRVQGVSLVPFAIRCFLKNPHKILKNIILNIFQF